MDESNVKSIKLKFEKIHVEEFSQAKLGDDFDPDVHNTVIFNTGYRFLISDNSDKVECNLKITIGIPNLIEDYISMTVANEFRIIDLQNITTGNDGDKTLPNELVKNLISLAISSTRGVVSERLRGTVLANHVYPLINPESVMEALLKGKVKKIKKPQ